MKSAITIDEVRRAGKFFSQTSGTGNWRIVIIDPADDMGRLREAFGYCLETPPGSNYPPIVLPIVIEDLEKPVEIHGPGGTIAFMPHLQQHGDIHSLGFRIGNVAYCSDVSDFPPQTVDKLQKLDMLIIDALQYAYHPSHLSLEQSLDWIERLKPKRAILTHMHTPLDYDVVMAETPDHGRLHFRSHLPARSFQARPASLFEQPRSV